MTRRALFPSPVHRRLAPLTAAAFFGGIALWVPVEKLFLAEIGFTPQTIGVMAAAYAAVVPLLEIPSGILADRWSRRGVLLIGNAGMVLSRARRRAQHQRHHLRRGRPAARRLLRHAVRHLRRHRL